MTADPDNLAVKEFRRTRRNRFVAATIVGVFGVLLSFASDALGVGTIVTMVLLVAVCYAYYRIFKSEQREEQDPDSFPAVAADLQLLMSTDEGAPEVAGYHAMPDGWLIKDTRLTLDFFRASDICWVYPTRTRHRVNFVPASAERGVVVGLKSGRILQSRYKEETVREKLRLLHRIAPAAIFGYSDDLKKAWERSRESFTAAAERRSLSGGEAGDMPWQ